MVKAPANEEALLRAFGRALRALRERAGYTQTRLACAARDGNYLPGIVPAAISHWETGRRLPWPIQLAAVFTALKSAPSPPTPRSCITLLKLAVAVNPHYQGEWLWRETWTPDQQLTDWLMTTTARPPRPTRGLARQVETGAVHRGRKMPWETILDEC